MHSSPIVLVVDDDSDVAKAHSELLCGLGYRVLVQTDPCCVKSELIKNSEIRLVLLDMRMPGKSGLEVLREIRTLRPEIGVIIATVVSDIELAVTATKEGAYNYLLKPLSVEALKKSIDSYFANSPKNLSDDSRFSSFITQSPACERIFERIKSFAETDVTVLIQGETGTGKELIAHLVHALSPRANEKYVAVNVSGLAPNLFESELFGHSRGAFTGASSHRVGYFEEAGEGTLLLDEIGELGSEQQKKLLRVIQTRRFCRVGETKERKLRARLIASTNCNLSADVKSGAFRADLYYRLESHSVQIPPLRERPGDIELLSEYFVRKYATQHSRSIYGCEKETVELLKSYSFPGNVRELEGMISAAVLIEPGFQIKPSILPRHVRIAGNNTANDLEQIRYRAVMRVLAECEGNQTEAAKQLGIARGTLNRLLRRYREMELTSLR